MCLGNMDYKKYRELVNNMDKKEKTFLGQNKTFWKGFYFGFITLALLVDIIYFGALFLR